MMQLLTANPNPNIILEGMNPQGGDDEDEEFMIQSPPRKR